MRKLKVLQIIPSFGVGGAEKVVLNYLMYNKSKSMSMKCVSLYSKGNSIYDKQIEEKSLDVVYLHKKIGFDFNIIKELKFVISDYDPDVIHTHLYALKYLALTGEMKNRTIFHTIHTEPNKDVGRVDRMVNKYFFKNHLVVPITLQENLAKVVNEYYKINNTYVIKNGINLQSYKKNDNMKRKQLGIGNDMFVVGHIGRFSKEKNHQFILKVFYEIIKVRSNAVLLLIGSGEEEDKVKDLAVELGIQNKVFFLGNREDIPELLNCMDVFFFPSLYEGLGIVLVEAQAAGVPCVVSSTVPDEVMLTKKIEKVDLNLPINEWVNKIIYPQKISNDNVDEKIFDYDISRTLKELENLYRKERQL